MLLHANCISRCRVTENMGYMQELEYRVKGKILPRIKVVGTHDARIKVLSIRGQFVGQDLRLNLGNAVQAFGLQCCVPATEALVGK